MRAPSAQGALELAATSSALCVLLFGCINVLAGKCCAFSNHWCENVLAATCVLSWQPSTALATHKLYRISAPCIRKTSAA